METLKSRVKNKGGADFSSKRNWLSSFKNTPGRFENPKGGPKNPGITEKEREGGLSLGFDKKEALDHKETFIAKQN